MEITQLKNEVMFMEELYLSYEEVSYFMDLMENEGLDTDRLKRLRQVLSEMIHSVSDVIKEKHFEDEPT